MPTNTQPTNDHTIDSRLDPSYARIAARGYWIQRILRVSDGPFSAGPPRKQAGEGFLFVFRSAVVSMFIVYGLMLALMSKAKDQPVIKLAIVTTALVIVGKILIWIAKSSKQLNAAYAAIKGK